MGYLCLCVVFNQGSCVFIQYNLLKGCCGWTLIQPWTKVIDYSLPWLTWHIRLRIGIFHLSSSGVVVLGRFYISDCFYFFVTFYDCLLADLLFLLLSLFSCLLTVVCAANNWLYPVYFLSDGSLNFIIIIITVVLYYSILYY